MARISNALVFIGVLTGSVCAMIAVWLAEAGARDPGTHTKTNSGRTAAPPAVRLFTTDFGGTVRMGEPDLDASRSGWWPIVGADSNTPFPISINGGTSLGLQPISYGPPISYDAVRGVIECGGLPCWKAEIVRGRRHDGSVGAIFHQQQFQSINWQLPYVVLPGSDVVEQYQKMWIKFPPELANQMGPRSWRVVSEWKDTGYVSPPTAGYRITVNIYTDAKGVPFWNMHGDNHPSGVPYWDLSSRERVPVGEWFLFEWAWHRTADAKAFAYVKVNGKKIMHQVGGGRNKSGFFTTPGLPINRIFLFQMYGAQSPSEQWIDHLEIWTRDPS